MSKEERGVHVPDYLPDTSSKKNNESAELVSESNGRIHPENTAGLEEFGVKEKYHYHIYL
jgi:hypothetical protein